MTKNKKKEGGKKWRKKMGVSFSVESIIAKRKVTTLSTEKQLLCVLQKIYVTETRLKMCFSVHGEPLQHVRSFLSQRSHDKTSARTQQ